MEKLVVLTTRSNGIYAGIIGTVVSTLAENHFSKAQIVACAWDNEGNLRTYLRQLKDR